MTRMRGLGLRGSLVVVAVVAWAPAAHGTYGAREILDARRQLYATAYAWKDQHEVMRVTMVDAHGRRQERTIELYERRHSDGARKILLVFLAPDQLKGTAVLSQARADGPTERWLYLPRQKRARRFAGQMKDEGLMGTDLTGAEIDLMHEMLTWQAADVHAILRGAERLEDGETHALEADAVGAYRRILFWLGRDDLVLRQLELYGTDLAPLKRVRQRDVRLVGTVPVPWRVEVENPASGTSSIFEVVDVQFDVGFPDDVFSLPQLSD